MWAVSVICKCLIVDVSVQCACEKADVVTLQKQMQTNVMPLLCVHCFHSYLKICDHLNTCSKYQQSVVTVLSLLPAQCQTTELFAASLGVLLHKHWAACMNLLFSSVSENALIMTDSQTRLCSKWQRESTHQSPLTLWLHRVTAEGAYHQKLVYFNINPACTWKCLVVSQVWIHNELWSLQSRQRREEMYSAMWFRHVSSLTSLIKAKGADGLQRLAQRFGQFILISAHLLCTTHETWNNDKLWKLKGLF